MEIIVHDELEKNKYVEIWLSSTENNDTEIEMNLKTMYAKYKNDKYRVVVFRSGTENLADNTKDLLLYNMECMAKASQSVSA